MQVGLVGPDVPRWPKLRWVAQALTSLGHRVHRVETIEQLQQADLECDVILFGHKAAGLNVSDLLQVADGHRSFWAQWWFDLIAVDHAMPLAEQQYLSADGFLPLMQAMDLVAVKERGMLEEYAALGIRAVWLDQGCPSWLEACEHEEIPAWDVLVLGTPARGYRQRRRDCQALEAAGYSVAWAGHPCGDGPPHGVKPLRFCPVEDLPKLFSQTAIVLDVGYRNDLDGYWSDRLLLALGAGACVLRRRTPGQPELPYYSYETEAELLDYVSVLRASLEHRRETGRLARDLVLAHHTYEHRVEELLCLCRARATARPVTAKAS